MPTVLAGLPQERPIGGAELGQNCSNPLGSCVAGTMSLKQISRISIRFNPMTPKTASIKEFLQRCMAPKAAASNPDCVVKTKLSIKDIEPTVSVEFANGNKEVFYTRGLTAEQITKAIKDKRELLDAQELLKKNGVTEDDKIISDWGTPRYKQPRVWNSLEQ